MDKSKKRPTKNYKMGEKYIKYRKKKTWDQLYKIICELKSI